MVRVSGELTSSWIPGIVISEDKIARRCGIVVRVLQPDHDRWLQAEDVLRIQVSAKRHTKCPKFSAESQRRSRLRTYFELFKMLEGILEHATQL
jgi:hypothetical protein